MIASSVSPRGKRKSRVKKRYKYGLAAVPLNEGFKVAKYAFYQDIEPSDIDKLVKGWIKANYSKSDVKAILANPAWHFTRFPHYGAAIFWANNDLPFPDDCSMYMDRIKEYFDELVVSGKVLTGDTPDAATFVKPRRLSPRELFENKLQATIMTDLDELEDDWIEGKKTDFNLYERFQVHGLKAATVPPVKARLTLRLTELVDARDKTCDQAVEAYSHIKPMELKRRIKVLETAIRDLDRIHTTSKIVRKSNKRLPKAKPNSQLVKGLKYLKESKTHKLISINPESIIGESNLYLFNEKTRAFTIYEAADETGLGVKGSTIQNFNPDRSFVTRLRKPDEFLPQAMTGAVKKVEALFMKLTTKKNTPNGRVNADTVILRSFKQAPKK